jgi:hypothetical protein
MVVYLYNEMAEYRLQNSRYFYYNGHKYYRATQQNMRERRAEAITAQSQRRHAKIKASYEKAYKKTLDIERRQEDVRDEVGLALSIGSILNPAGLGLRMGIAGMLVDASQPDIPGLAIGAGGLRTEFKYIGANKYFKAVDLFYSWVQVVIPPEGY